MTKTSLSNYQRLNMGPPAESEALSEINFTLREREIIHGISQDMSAKMIALALDISVFTVQEHIKNIKNKMEVHTPGAIIAGAFRLGLIE